MPRPETIRRWTERLQRFKQSDMTVAQFCRAEGISPPSFYQWKRELGEETSLPDSAFLPVTLPAPPTSSVSSPHSTTTIELPGGVRVQIEVAIPTSSNTEGASS